jgi:hypothetical protein
MSFEIQELRDVIKIAVLLNMVKGEKLEVARLKHRIDRVCGGDICVDLPDVKKSLRDLSSEGLLLNQDNVVRLTKRGDRLSNEWRSLLLKRDPVLEVVAGLTDGSITGLVVILSAYIASLASNLTLFVALLTLSSVSITNFSSFLLGGITEDLSDIVTLQNLVNYSLGDIPDRKERGKSLRLAKRLFMVLHRQTGRSNLYSATLCSLTTFAAGSVPIAIYMALQFPLGIIFSLVTVGVVAGGFLVHYRSRKTKVHWKVTLFETSVIILIAVVASLLIGVQAI